MGVKYFVYVADTHGAPVPQIWHNAITDGNGKTKATLMMREIEASEDMLSINSLVAKYPYVGKQE